MKRILLASTAIVAFAGAAAAEVTFTGTATLGYNDTDSGAGVVFVLPATNWDNEEGFYSDLDITAGLSQELDNGLTVAASINLDDFGNGTDTGYDYVLSLTAENAGLYYGDTAFAAETHWVSAGDMETDGFSEADGEVALRGDVTFGAVSASVSYVLANNIDNDNAIDDLNQLSVGATADFGNFNVVLAYQEASGEAGGFYSANLPVGIPTDGDNGDFNDAEIFGLSVGTSFAGADVRLAYSDNSVDDSIGVKVAYPFGPVTATAYYVAESNAAGDNWGLNFAYENGPVAVAFDYQDDQSVVKMGLEGSYDVGNGMMVYAGYLTQDATSDRYYVAGTYDLGSGASLLVSYAEDTSHVDEDEIGAGEYQEGTTVEVSFEF